MAFYAVNSEILKNIKKKIFLKTRNHHNGEASQNPIIRPSRQFDREYRCCYSFIDLALQAVAPRIHLIFRIEGLKMHLKKAKKKASPRMRLMRPPGWASASAAHRQWFFTSKIRTCRVWWNRTNPALSHCEEADRPTWQSKLSFPRKQIIISFWHKFLMLCDKKHRKIRDKQAKMWYSKVYGCRMRQLWRICLEIPMRETNGPQRKGEISEVSQGVSIWVR